METIVNQIRANFVLIRALLATRTQLGPQADLFHTSGYEHVDSSHLIKGD